MNKTPRLIGSAQAAKKYGVDRATFNRWVKAGSIPIALELDGTTGARLYDENVIDQLATEYREAKQSREAAS